MTFWLILLASCGPQAGTQPGNGAPPPSPREPLSAPAPAPRRPDVITILPVPPGPPPAPRRVFVPNAHGRPLRVLLQMGDDMSGPSPSPMGVCRIRGVTVVADSGGRLFRLGGDGTRTQLPARGHVMNISCDDEAIYHGDGHRLFRESIEGASAVLAEVEEDPLEIVLDDDYAYFNVYQRRTLYRVPKRGGPVVRIATGARRPSGLALDEGALYWADYGAGTIQRVAKTGGAVTTLARGQGHPVAIALDRESVYWANETTGSLHRVAKSGGRPTELLRGETNNDILVTDDEFLYWYSWTSGVPGTFVGHSFSRMPLGGGPPEVLLSGLHMPESFVIDGGRLYLVNKGPGELLELTL